MTLNQASISWAVRHCLQTSTSLEQATEVLTAYGLDAGKIAGLVGELDRGAGFVWQGRGAEALTLDGEASGRDVSRLLTTGTTPHGESIAGRGGIRRAKDENGKPCKGHGSGGGSGAYGIVRAEDKTVSILLAHPDDRVREAAQRSHAAANASYIATLERLIRSRSGRNGVMSESITGLTSAVVTHYSTSSGDPLLHSHILVSKMVLCADGKHRAIDGNTLFGAMAAAEAAAQRTLGRELQTRLGVKVAFSPVGSAKMAEIPSLRKVAAPLCEAKRRLESVLDDMSRLFGPVWAEQRDAWRKYRAGAGQAAEAVEHATDAALRTPEGREAIRVLWDDRSPGLLSALGKITPNATPTPPAAPAVDEGKVRAEAWAWACDQETVRWSDLTARLTCELGIERAGEVALELLSHSDAVQAVAPEQAHEAVSAIMGGGQCATENLRAVYGRASRFTTAPAIARAELFAARARALGEGYGVALDVKYPATATADQQHAIARMAAGRRLCAITGVAGAGKTFSAAPVADAARERGLEVISLARNAARALETGEGIQADRSCSLARFFKQGPPDGPAVIFLDEGGVVDRADYNALLDILEQRPDLQLVTMGDARQAQSIDRLDSWTLLEEAAQKAGSHADLVTSRRTAAWTQEHDAIRSMAAPAEMLDQIEQEKRLIPVTQSNYTENVVFRLSAEPGTTAIVATNAEAAEISGKMQKSLGITGVIPCRGDNRLGIGDRVRTRQNNRDGSIFNGDEWTVTSTSRAGVTLTRVDGKREVTVDRKYVRENVELAYASTLDSAQGITVQRAVFVVSEGIGNTGLYSATTRGKQAPVYMVVTDSDAENPAEQARERLKKTIQTDDKSENALTFKNERPAPPAFAWATTTPDPDTPPPETPAAKPEPAPSPTRSPRLDGIMALRRARAQAAQELLATRPVPTPTPTPESEPPPWEPPAETWEPPAP